MLIKASAFALLAFGAFGTFGALGLLAAAPAFAADAPPDKPADSPDAAKTDPAKTDAPKADDKAGDPYDPFEDPGKNYLFVGLRYRDAIVPSFMIHWFASGGATVNVPMIGPEFTKRRDGFEVDVAVMYADYGKSPFLVKGKSDPPTSYELISSSLKQVYFMADLLWEVPLEKSKEGKVGRFSLLFGGGVGLGVVFGSLYRSQAYPNVANADPNNPAQWNACQSPNSAQTGFSAGYCNNPTNNHYWPSWSASNRNTVGAGAYAEPSWVNGGDKPNIFPWIAIPQIGFRYKPIKQLQTKVNIGFSTTGFFFDISASYGL
jgi:hypothetical protein